MYSPDNSFDPWVSGIRNLGTMLLQMPQIRAQAQHQRAATELTQEQTGLTRARTQQVGAETDELLRKGQLVTALEQWAPAAMQDMAAGNTDTEAVQNFQGAVAAITGVNKGDLQESFKKGLGTMLARQGKGEDAAWVEDAPRLETANIQGDTDRAVADIRGEAQRDVARLKPSTPMGEVLRLRDLYDQKKELRKQLYEIPLEDSSHPGAGNRLMERRSLQRQLEEVERQIKAAEGTSTSGPMPTLKGPETSFDEATTWDSPDSVKEAVLSGQLDQQEAIRILVEQFGFEP